MNYFWRKVNVISQGSLRAALEDDRLEFNSFFKSIFTSKVNNKSRKINFNLSLFTFYTSIMKVNLPIKIIRDISKR